MIRTVARVIAEGVLWAGLGVFLLWLTLPAGFPDAKPAPVGGLFANHFARRWDGTCSGWTRDVAAFQVVNDLLLWNAYVVIALVMWRLHPILKRVSTHRNTVHLICVVFLTCGATHLFSAYSVFNPVYVFDGAFKLFAGLIGFCTAVYVAHDLVVVFDQVEAERNRLEFLEAKLAGRSDVAEPGVSARGTRGRVLKIILQGLLCALLALGIWLLPRGPVGEGVFRNNFASQWAGTCAGWTRPLALLYLAGSLITWFAYAQMGWVVWRLHPASRRVPAARVMVPAVSAVLASCGSVHLVEAYAMFNPIFIALGILKLLVAVVSLVGAALVSQTLVAVFDATVRDRRRLMELEARFSA